jgi:uncharacterized SAM-binding protein YcdF (DUF218 family)
MRTIRFLIFLIGMAAIAWFAGLGVFVESIEAMEANATDMKDTDAIVVLTGGSERVSTGIDLLSGHKAKKLFVSGVHPGSALENLPEANRVPPDLRACCISLGHAAESTFGNAEETRDWMETEHYTSMRLVTANYHMPRSLLIFRAAMPDFEIIPHPVAPDNVKLDDWWLHSGTASLLINEYNKYLIARTRLWLGFV